jgi:acyl-CoA synthetase (AMP-forming)/AMP-acid ligase II/acyl carrier protein
LDQRARAIAGRLQAAGASGQRVLLVFPPGLDYIAAFFGCLYAEAVAVPVYPPRQNRNVERLRAIVYDAQPVIALTTQPILSQIGQYLDEAADMRALPWVATDSVESGWASQWKEPRVDGDTLAFLQYTSGSTAKPKGVMISHGNLLHNQQSIQEAFGQSERSVIVGWLPLFHDMGLIGNVLQPLYVGAQCILLSPMSFLQRPFRWLETISRYQGTTSGGPNFAYDFCVRKINEASREALDLSSWVIAFNGSERVRKETMDRFCAAFEPCGFRREAFFPCYGLAEATLFVSGGPAVGRPNVQSFRRTSLEQNSVAVQTTADRDVRNLVSCGDAARDQQIRIVDPELLKECSPDRVGEIWIAGPNTAQGYWNNPEATNQAFHAHLADTGEGPFLRTGDLGFVAGGQLFITGRLKDLIIIRGRNCYPEDIEQTVGQCDSNLRPGEGAAFSIDVSGDERLVIVHEVTKDAQRNNLATAVENIRRVVAEEYDLQLYAVVLIKPGSLLKTSSGKIQRQATKKAFQKGKLDALLRWELGVARADKATESFSAASFAVTAEWIAHKLAGLLGLTREQIDLSVSITRYGLDSLAAIELAHSIEENFGATIPVLTLIENISV